MSSRKEQRIHYIHGLSYTARERLVGAFVLVALLVILGLIFVNSRTSFLFESRIVYHAYLKNAQGVSTDSVVKVSGMEVGKVSDLDIADDNRVHITLYVYKRYRNLIRVDSRASLSKLSVLGKSSIDIHAGSPASPVMPENAVLDIEEPLSLEQLMADLTPVMARVKRIVDGVALMVEAVEPARLQSLSVDLSRTAGNLRSATDQMIAGEGTLGRLVYDAQVEQDLITVVDRLASVLDRTDRRMAELEPILAHARDVAGTGTELSRELTALIVEGRQTVNHLNVALGTANVELQQLPELVSRMKLLMESTDKTLQGLQRIWPLSSAVPDSAGSTMVEPRPGHD